MKGHILKLVMAIMIAITLVTCTKFGKNITVKGRVINPITNEPISGITVFMHQSWKSKTIKKMVTGQDGEFELSATHLGHVWAGTDYSNYQDYYDLGWDYKNKYYSEIKVEKGKTMNVDYHLVPYGILKLHVFNQNCQGATDSLDIFFDGSDVLTLTGKEDANNSIGSILFEPIVGCWDKTDNGFNTQMGRRFYHWTVTRNGIKTTFYDTVYVIPNSITTLNVFY